MQRPSRAAASFNPDTRSALPSLAAVTLELWRDPENDAEASCCSASAVRAARAVAHDLGLPHFTLDLREEFRAGVVQPWLDDHRAGLTPNPCVRCNGGVRLDAMVAFADRLGAADLPWIDDAVRPYFRDVWDHVQRAEFRLSGLREVAGSVVDTNSLLEQQRQGAITRQLAAWAAILAVPTAIAGIYGMNFEHMPELGWTFGYPFAIALMASICGLLYWRFRTIRWL